MLPGRLVREPMQVSADQLGLLGAIERSAGAVQSDPVDNGLQVPRLLVEVDVAIERVGIDQSLEQAAAQSRDVGVRGVGELGELRVSGRLRGQCQVHADLDDPLIVDREEFLEGPEGGAQRLWVVEVGADAVRGALVHEAHGEGEQVGLRGEDVPHGSDDQAGLGRDGPQRYGAHSLGEDDAPHGCRDLPLALVVIDESGHGFNVAQLC